MTRKEHVCFCRVCDNSKFSKEKGLICGLTDDLADFEVDCINFSGDRSKIVLPESKRNDSMESLLNPEPKVKKENPFFKFLVQHLVTTFLAAVLLIVFLVMLLSGAHIFEPDIQSMIKWGANTKLLSFGGQFWRLITSNFIHFGIIHLLFNLYALIFVGMHLERLIGHYRLFISFMITGIVSAITTALWHDSALVTAGASGAIFGLFGVYIAVLTTGFVEKKLRSGLLISVIVFVAYNLLGGMKEGIDNVAHIGGLCSGLVIGYALYPSLKHKDSVFHEYIVGSVPVILLFVACVVVVLRSPDRLAEMDELYQEFYSHENKALKFYELDRTRSQNEFISYIDDISIPEFEKCIEVAAKINQIDGLTDEHYYIASLFERYANYRIECFSYIRRNIDENTSRYTARIYYYDKIMQKIIGRLQGDETPDSLLVTDPKVLAYEESKRDQVEETISRIRSGLGQAELLEEFLDYRDSKPEVKRIMNSSVLSWRFKNDYLTNEQKLADLEDILYVIDGNPVETLENFDISSIITMTYYTPDVAKSFYGEKGLNGAVLITTK
ncbi:rhomboid family intramembrane serine protease [Saccharicrinis sp. FJH62]|uniref:rhomboid family intramembrane serine protease n=1 Tax=Saccharicrinis sp. FJH62 TaxID=3344657 RepID=UPI0035D4390F